jgi:hypothetical protein
MPSIGYTNPISGSNGSFNLFVRAPQNSGGAIKGYMPQTTLKTDKDYKEYEQIRFTLKESWNTTYPSQLKRANKKAIITPFRAVTNSGDLLSREYYSCGGSCQSFQSRPGMFGLKQRFGANQNTCVPGVVYSTYQLDTSIPAAACNVKYVYDSSDYTTYLKQKAINKNYNDLSYGGNDSSGSQSAYRAARRY